MNPVELVLSVLLAVNVVLSTWERRGHAAEVSRLLDAALASTPSELIALRKAELPDRAARSAAEPAEPIYPIGL